MDVVFLDLALMEADEAIDYYEDQMPDLGKSFHDELFSSIDIILQHPKAWTKVGDRTRRCILKRFPYFIFYIDEPEQITITAVGHQHRDPEYFSNRVV